MKIDILKTFIKFFLPSKNEKIDRKEINISEIKNILIVSNTAIGDTLFATPAIRELKLKYENIKITALMNPNNYTLFETNPYIDEIITYSGKWKDFLSTLKKLKSMNFDMAFIFHANEPQATPLAYLSGIKYIIKAPNEKNEFNYLHYNDIYKLSREYTVLTRLNQLKYLNIEANNLTMQLFLDKTWENDANNFIKNIENKKKIIGIQIGASTISRMWFKERWVELINRILENDLSISIVLTGSPNEKKIVADVYNEIKLKNRVFNAAGKLNLGSAAALISKFVLFITPDTGPLHIAASLKVNTIALYVAGDPLGTNPISNDKEIQHLYISKDKTCTPCKDKRCQFQECMLQIEVYEVFQLYKKILSGNIHD